ncbi:hypothetical protein PVAND_005285 [Polypedilum vanderplanki]|uniref:Uncharacterized protein n=1 Tax=Polypedilum vanderplanki TaxID=319348 RepID=A0A9J6C0D9_POLVA|nr:hypothetical protein PVAND_005285 [Polypedilum vanderplanki]
MFKVTIIVLAAIACVLAVPTPEPKPEPQFVATYGNYPVAYSNAYTNFYRSPYFARYGYPSAATYYNAYPYNYAVY